jgi:hypothetical protein
LRVESEIGGRLALSIPPQRGSESILPIETVGNCIALTIKNVHHLVQKKICT